MVAVFTGIKLKSATQFSSSKTMCQKNVVTLSCGGETELTCWLGYSVGHRCVFAAGEGASKNLILLLLFAPVLPGGEWGISRPCPKSSPKKRETPKVHQAST